MKGYMSLCIQTVIIIAFFSYILYLAVFKGQFDDIDEKGDSILLDDDSTSHLVTIEKDKQSND